MARPHKKGLDYFPLDVTFDDDIELLEAEHGLIGFAILIKLWQKIYTNGYFIEWKSDSSLLFSKKINTELTIVSSVINTCLRRNLFDNNLYEKCNILTSSGIQKRFITAAAQSKRKTISIISEFILVNSEFIELITEETQFTPEFSTQSKVKKIKEKERINKGNNFDFIFSFDQFWELYPNKVAKEKCEQKFYKLSELEIEQIKNTLPDFVKHKPFDSYNHPHPETYLNQKRWNDELKKTITINPKNDEPTQDDPTKPGYGKTWEEMTDEERDKNKGMGTNGRLKIHNEKMGYGY